MPTGQRAPRTRHAYAPDHGAARRASSRRRAEYLAEPVEHPLLSLAHAHGVEAHEAALLGRVGRLLRGVDQPRADGGRLLRRRLGRDEAVYLAELVHGPAGGPAGLGQLEAPERAPAPAPVRHPPARQPGDALPPR